EGGRRALARLDTKAPRELEVADGWGELRSGQREADREHHVAVGVLERAGAEAELAALRIPVLDQFRLAVVHPKRGDGVGDLGAVRADVLDGRRAGEPRNS